MRHVVLCDESGNPTGTEDVSVAHEPGGKLHQAFSAFVFRDNGNELLLQQRQIDKRFGNLWANTCCSHPQQNEDIVKAAEGRLQEELGFTCPLKTLASFIYTADDTEGRGTEYEYDTILIGMIDEETSISPDPNEVAATRWITLEKLQEELDEKPETFAPWFPIALSHIFSGQ